MASNRYKLIWEVFLLFVLLLSAKAIAKNNEAANSELYSNGEGRRLAGQPPCRNSRAALGKDSVAYDNPRCHNYL
ncbi:hypothetical protein L6164_017577 [Bauhinia variegata]|uniref:Uncharacterized protein n=1 Tax=Bauhinia variegata TaxID=167791 RepID=A0ACB9NAF5_BAUVA|nr:hypothetical protein L6164_017577 [Bauhinia variegata]